jgi:hypothetical protein
VDFSGVLVCILLLFGPLAIAAAGGYLRSLYLLCIRQCERSLADKYSLSFQVRATEARTLNANVGSALVHAKRAVDEARTALPDIHHAHAALSQVSDWLGSAAETSDRALRSLENQHHSTNKPHTAVFTQRDLHE